MREQLPLFPLNMVMFPGVSMPLHVFEDRYRALVHHLLTIADKPTRLFGIVAIREGYEVGQPHAALVQSLHRVGCVVQMTSVEPYEDGRFDIEVVGRQRLRLDGVDTSGSYLVGDVDTLTERTAKGNDTAHEAARTLGTFRGVPATALRHAGRRGARRQPSPRPGASLLQPGGDVPAHPAGTTGPAGGRDGPRAAGHASARTAGGDAGDAGDPVATGDRGGSHQVVTELISYDFFVLPAERAEGLQLAPTCLP